MANLSILNFDALTNVYFVANTPSYLFRHYRNDQSVQQFADAHSVEELAEEVTRVSLTELAERTMNDIVSAYAAIVGLTFKDVTAVNAVTSNLDFKNIHWGKRILFLWEPYPVVDVNMYTSTAGLPTRSEPSMSVITQPS